MDSSSLWSYGDILVDGPLEDEVEVEFSVVLDKEHLTLLLIDKELAELEDVGLASLDLGSVHISEDSVMDLVALSLNVEHEWPCLSLHIASEVVVVSELVLRLEEDLDRDLALRRNNSRKRQYLQAVSVVWLSSDRVLAKVEGEGNVFLVYDRDHFSVLSIQEQRAKLDFSGLEEHIRLIDSTHY